LKPSNLACLPVKVWRKRKFIRNFGDPVYTYSLKDGINDGFLTPFKVKRIKTTLDDYVYTSDDEVIEGEVEEGKRYEEKDFNRTIEIKEREAKRVKIFLNEIDEDEKTIVFCANQAHAAAVRDLINQLKKNSHLDYCVRVTANDGALGEQYLREFQDNEKTLPTILTTSQKLSTGVDARNVRNIVLMRSINSMIEFKQIIGRGTRLFDGKEYFTIFDFVDAHRLFFDPAWDGEAIDEEVIDENLEKPEREKKILQKKLIKTEDFSSKQKLKIKLRDGKEREIQHMIQTSFLSENGKPISAEEFLNNLFGVLPEFFKNEDELRKIWSNPRTRKIFLEKISEIGYDSAQLEDLQKIVNAKNSDLFDVLSYISFAKPLLSRQQRVDGCKKIIFEEVDAGQKEFLEFVLQKYIDEGFEELAEDKLAKLLELKYDSVFDASQKLGGAEKIRSTFFDFQWVLYGDCSQGDPSVTIVGV
jgi:type I restriction enzyme R subunit